MKAVTKGQEAALACGLVVSLATGNGFVFGLVGLAIMYTWLVSPACRPQLWAPKPRQPRQGVGTTAACYDYGGCQWRGDGCNKWPVVLGPGTGCSHTNPRVDAPARTPHVCTRCGQFAAWDMPLTAWGEPDRVCAKCGWTVSNLGK